MRLFKPKYKDREGQKKRTQKWYLDFFTQDRRRYRLPLFTDKRASEGVRNTIAECISCKVVGFVFEPELQRKLDVLPTRILQRLSNFGLLDSARVEGSKPLIEHIQDWENSLVAGGCTKKHLQAVVPRVEKVIRECSFKMISDIDTVKAERFLLRLRDTGTIGKSTFNGYVRSLRQFGKWLVDVGRTGRNPFGMLKKTTFTKADQKRPARILSIDEVRALISTTANAPAWHGISGHERSLIYLLCNETGLRANEVRQLSVGDFDFSRATVTIRSAVAKNRKEAILPIKRTTAELIQRYCKDKLPTARAFNVPAKPHLMIKHDLEAAGIAYKTDEGTAHFHAQRHNFATALSVSTANVKTAQDLLRHSDPRLTLGVYTHGIAENQRAAIENLPDLTLPSIETQRAIKTGTDGQSIFDVRLDNTLSKQCVLNRTNLDCSGLNTPKAQAGETMQTALKTAIVSGISDYPRCDSNAQPLASEANALSY